MSTATTAPQFEFEDSGTAQADSEWNASPFSASSPITFSVQNAPTGLTINPHTGEISWMPTEAQVGQHVLTVVGSNSAGATDEQCPILVLADIPTLGYLVNYDGRYEGNSYGIVDQPMDVWVTNYSPTPGKLSVISGPAGLKLTTFSDHSIITWTPGLSDAGDVSIHVRSRNLYGEPDLLIQFPVYATPAVSNITVKTDGPSAPTMSWTLPSSSDGGEKIAGYNIQLQAFGPHGSTTYSFDRSSTASSFKLQSLPKGLYDFIPTVTPLDATRHAGVSATGSAFTYAGVSPTLIVPEASLTVTATQSVGQFYLSDSNTGLFPIYKLVSGPTGLTVSGGGAVDWTPALSQVGTYNVEFAATTSLGTVTGSMRIEVDLPVPGEPDGAWVTDPTSTGFTVSWLAPGYYPDFVVGYNIYIQYAPNASLDESAIAGYIVAANVFTFHFSTPVLGDFQVRIAAFNNAGIEGPPIWTGPIGSD